MKHIIILFLSILTISAYGQDKYNHLYSDRLVEIKGTPYAFLKVENWGKLSVRSQYLLFINTQNGQSTRIDFPKDGWISKTAQIKIDSLQINKVMVLANTVNLDNSKHIDGGDPTQIILLSPDGQEKTQLTDDKFYVRDWVVNEKTGGMLVTGHYDSNNNSRYDKGDDYQILLYDLKTLKLVSRVQE
ncbi:hypothetical protein L3C95_26135 [Chitinophaga filiformis]|uniref:hypothetical protein n=1 Tax=Chitinophaga filiformis TaxID=104663 RepID=UPI001F450CA3|nr:hypothetical protein [Chitinophaga filiformis]MCF6406402.1 hypothetical protein [Chitinophaga filiformis]